jgi:hypothetical protein
LAVAELRQNLSQEKEEKEEMRTRLESRLEDQSKIIEDMKMGIKENLSEKSLKEELEEDALLEEVDCWEKLIFKNPPVSVFHYLVCLCFNRRYYYICIPYSSHCLKRESFLNLNLWNRQRYLDLKSH